MQQKGQFIHNEGVGEGGPFCPAGSMSCKSLANPVSPLQTIVKHVQTCRVILSVEEEDLGKETKKKVHKRI